VRSPEVVKADFDRLVCPLQAITIDG